MIEKISAKILDLLQSDIRLYAGGNAYAAGWTGVKRPDVDGPLTATDGYVNLFDKPYDDDGSKHRPAVYVGTKAVEATDIEEYQVQTSSGHVSMRLLTIPLVICVQAVNKTDARKGRNQLRQNIKSILNGSRVLTDHWYWLDMTGASGGGLSDRVSTTSTGGGPQQVSEGLGFLPIAVHYSWTEDCDA